MEESAGEDEQLDDQDYLLHLASGIAKSQVLEALDPEPGMAQMIAKTFRARLIFLEETYQYQNDVAQFANEKAEAEVRKNHRIRSLAPKWVEQRVANAVAAFAKTRKIAAYNKVAERLLNAGLVEQSLFLKGLLDFESDEELQKIVKAEAQKRIEPSVTKTFSFQFFVPQVESKVIDGKEIQKLVYHREVSLDSEIPGWALFAFNGTRLAANIWNQTMTGIKSLQRGYFSPRRLLPGSYPHSWEISEDGQAVLSDANGDDSDSHLSMWDLMGQNLRKSWSEFKTELLRLRTEDTGSEIKIFSHMANFSKHIVVKIGLGTPAISLFYTGGAIANLAVNLGVMVPVLPGMLSYGVLSQVQPEYAHYGLYSAAAGPALALARTALAYAWARVDGSESPLLQDNGIRTPFSLSPLTNWLSAPQTLSPAMARAGIATAAAALSTTVLYQGLGYAYSLDTSWLSSGSSFALPIFGSALAASMAILISQPLANVHDKHLQEIPFFAPGLGRSLIGFSAAIIGGLAVGPYGYLAKPIEQLMANPDFAASLRQFLEMMEKVPVDHPGLLAASLILGGANTYAYVSSRPYLRGSLTQGSYAVLKNLGLFSGISLAAYTGLNLTEWTPLIKYPLLGASVLAAIPLASLLGKTPALLEAERAGLSGIGQIPMVLQDQTANLAANLQAGLIGQVKASGLATHNFLSRELLSFTLVDFFLRSLRLGQLHLPSAQNSRDMASLIEGPGILSQRNIARTIDRHWAVLTLIAQAQLEILSIWREKNKKDLIVGMENQLTADLDQQATLYVAIVKALRGQEISEKGELGDLIRTAAKKISDTLGGQYTDAKMVIEDFLEIAKVKGQIKFTRIEFTAIVEAFALILEQELKRHGDLVKPDKHFWKIKKLDEGDYKGLAEQYMALVYGDHLIVEDSAVRLEFSSRTPVEELFGVLVGQGYEHPAQIKDALADRLPEPDEDQKDGFTLNQIDISHSAKMACRLSFSM